MGSRVVVITGASSGIGASLARNLAAKGYRVVLAARREALLKEVASEAGGETLTVTTDVTKRRDVEHLRDSALEKFGQIDVWINNAGWATGKSVMELQDEDIQAMVDVVIKASIYGMQAIVPYFQQRGEGHIVNVSSVTGRVPFSSFRSMYGAAKSGLNMLTANLRTDLAEKYPGIHVSLVLPGMVDTDFHRIAKTPFPVKAGERMRNVVVLSAQEVADAIAGLLEHPVPELYVPAEAAETVKQYYQDVGAFEARLRQR
jgi:NADP-dependent 3-hydroxy acid dehydrogenase YdfG